MVIDEFKFVIKKLSEMTGIDLFQYRESYLKRRIELRMKIKGAKTYREYLKIIEKDENELRNFVDTITINVTEFMRDKTPFQYFKNIILPKIAEKKRAIGSNLLRFWSAGCAYGEEAYSIAICVLESLGNDWVVSIYGTDIDEKCLEIAKKGIYKDSQLKNLNKFLINKYFDKINGMYKIKDEVKKLVRFKKHDLTTEGPISRYFDAIFCRNVMIYFTEDQKRKVINDFYEALTDGGYLIIGKSETLPNDFKDKFRPVNLKERIYIKV